MNVDRSADAYNLIIGQSLSRVLAPAIAAMLKEIFKLPGIRRAGQPGDKRGRFTIVESEVAGLKIRHYLDYNAKESIYPTSLSLEYDEEAFVDAPQTNGSALTNGANGHANGAVNGSVKTNGVH